MILVVILTSSSKLKGGLSLELRCVYSGLVPSLFMSPDRSCRHGDAITPVAKTSARVCICVLVLGTVAALKSITKSE